MQIPFPLLLAEVECFGGFGGGGPPGDDCEDLDGSCARPCHEAFLANGETCDGRWTRQYDPTEFIGRMFPWMD